MPNLKTRKIFAPEPDFLAFPDHYVNIVGKIAFADLAGMKKNDANIYGDKNVIPRGTLVNMDADGNVKKPTEDLVPNAVLFNTIFIDDYDNQDATVNATVLVHGFVRKDRLKELTSGDAGKLVNALIHVVNK